MMQSSELREKYLAFFEAKGCKRVSSSSLIPDDPSMLLTSAGMVQFKPWFLQQRHLEAPYIGATSVQKCVRTTDIDVIGSDGRHLSFFEMLGNFSFGDYFKSEMCTWALEFSTQVLGFAAERLYFTVFEDDDETVEIWRSLGIPAERITRLGAADNFWRAGPTGPCGPCSELYYDQGPEYGCGREDCGPGCACDRYLEYWNLVFTQYDAQEDGSLVPLPRKNIDTGMGLERAIAILNGLASVFQTDILRQLISIVERISGRIYGQAESSDRSMRIIADHLRSCTFMIGDGILPANESRGYVLRRLLRRAMRHGHLLAIDQPFLVELAQTIMAEMGDVYPEIRENRQLIERIIQVEEERFAQTLHLGQNYLEASLAGLSAGDTLSGTVAFELHDRYGFPIDLTEEISTEAGLTVDRTGFEALMQEQRQRARDALQEDAWGSIGSIFTEIASQSGATRFLGYDSDQAAAEIQAIVVEKDGTARLTSAIEDGQTAQIILDQTPFYAEMGGQVGDTGWLTQPTTEASFAVIDTQVQEQVVAHLGQAHGRLAVGDSLLATIDNRRRQRIARNHTATHLLHQALREVLGEHVQQAGSLVAPDHLRFDFTHFEPLSLGQLAEVEARVNELILADAAVTTTETSLAEARAAGVIALFGEKYGERVRVLTAGPESRELCGGTHVRHTAQIGLFKILSESSVAASVRRIEAVTAADALTFVRQEEEQLQAAAALLKTRPADLSERIIGLQTHLHELEETVRSERQAALGANAAALLDQRLPTAAYPIIVQRLDGLNVEELREVWDNIRQALTQQADYDGAAALVTGGITPSGTPLLLAAATDRAVERGFNANLIIKQIALAIQGGGGGKATLAQAGGKDITGLDRAFQQARELLV